MLKQYKMTNMDWIEEHIQRLGLEAFCNFQSRVNSALDKLQPGRYYDLATSVTPQDQELFIKFCCCYINQHQNYEMSDDYCQIHNKK